MKKINVTKNFIIIVVFVFSLIFITANNYSYGNDPQNTKSKYSLLKVFVQNSTDMQNINRQGLYFDHSEAGEGYLEVWLSDSEIQKLNASGVPYETVIDDFEKYYNEQHKMTAGEIQDAIHKSKVENNVSHSVYGSMGGYLTYNEVIGKLDSMRLEYPNLISVKFSIGNSLENRPMWTVRVSNSPNAPTGRTEIWYHSLIHAREPMSMEQNIYFMYWLLENYNIDPVATYLMNTREFYFTPVFNPDGYEYNRSTNPTGGGFWRKNRSVNGGGSFGVDLNRNFGIYEFWNSSNGGSSTNPGDDTYRGLSPFSEPETQNARNFVISRNFKGILSYHTYGNYLIRPWGYQSLPTPDENIFQSFSQDMVLNDHFTLGRTNETVGYGVRGVTDDWYYNDSAHSKVIAMTPEVGTSSDGFWPAQSRILPLAKITLSQNIYFALSSGANVATVKTNMNKEQYIQGEAGNLKVYFKNKGLVNAQNVNIELVSQSPQLSIQTTAFSFSNIASQSSDSIAFNFTVGTGALINGALKTSLIIKQDNTNMISMQDVYIPVGGGNVLLLDSAENGMTKWTTNAGGWGVTTSQSYSPSNSFTDSPIGNYVNNAVKTMTLATALNVSANPILKLSFWYKHNIEILDNAYVDVSNDNGVTWQSAKFYNGVQSNWTREMLDITSLAGASATLKIRFSLVSNGAVTSDGIYVDNIKLAGYTNAPTGIISNTEVPAKFSLSQNYPNPFNPGTVIKYNLASGNFVSLKVYDILGKEMITLVNERQNAGSYSISFNSSNLSSGLYYYRIVAGDGSNNSAQGFVDTKKMLLIK